MNILSQFSSFHTKDEQDIYLQGLIKSVPVKRRRPNNAKDAHTAHISSYKFHVLVDSVQVEVCRKAFISMHGIGEKRVRRLQHLLVEGKSPHDRRGQHVKKCVATEERLMIHNHISSFPVKRSHYASRDYSYLHSNLSVKVMYDLFKEKYPDSQVTYKFYLKYFNENFNLSFGSPQVDTCSVCEELTMKIKSPTLNDVAKRVASAELLVHKRRASKFHAVMKQTERSCQENDTVLGLCFDFMQNLPLPHIPVQDIFYLRQLWVNVFCIHDIKANKAVMYVYHEGQAKKGANEVCSFLYHYIQEYVPAGIKVLHLYSDACTGQNRNHSMIRFLTSLTDTRRFEEIVHRFPVRGHSYLPCDRDFGRMKRMIRQRDRIYTPMEYVECIVNSTKQQLFTVHMVNTEEVLDFNQWWPKFYKKGGLSVESLGAGVPRHSKVSFSPASYAEFVYKAAQQHVVVTSEYINGLIRHTFDLGMPGVRCINMPQHMAYPHGKVPLNTKKVADIKKVVKYVEHEYLGFYTDILNWPVDNIEDDDA